MPKKIVTKMNADIPNYLKPKSPDKKNKKQTETHTDEKLTLGALVSQFEVLKEQLPVKTINKHHLISRLMMTRNQGP